LDLGPFMAREVDERPGLNSKGQIAAWQIVEKTRAVAVLIDGHETKPIDSGSSSNGSFAFGVNDRNTVVGILESRNDLRKTEAFLYQRGVLQVLPALGGKVASAKGISNKDTVVGNAETQDGHMHAAMWVDRNVHDLGLLGGGDFSRAFEINDFGEVAGEANLIPNGKPHAVLWSHSGIHDLGLLPGGSSSSAQAVNKRHHAVGFADDEDGGSRAVLFSNGGTKDLGSLGDEPSIALSINDLDQIVGTSAVAEGKLRAFLWEQGHLFDLNKLIPEDRDWLLLTAYRINQRGEILAEGFHNGATHLCLLTPIP
jgi:probable HAF family extracellular repeat protein